MDIQLVKERITILAVLAMYKHENRAGVSYFGDRGGKNNNFVKFSHTLHELINTRSLDDIHIVILSFNLDGNCEICLVEYLNLVLARKR